MVSVLLEFDVLFFRWYEHCVLKTANRFCSFFLFSCVYMIWLVFFEVMM
jgi:hypothetical protein